jgi:hypothetical protein
VEIRAQLINLVRRTPELYDKNDPRYKNNAHKGVLWSRIAREIGNGATGKELLGFFRGVLLFLSHADFLPKNRTSFHLKEGPGKVRFFPKVDLRSEGDKLFEFFNGIWPI